MPLQRKLAPEGNWSVGESVVARWAHRDCSARSQGVGRWMPLEAGGGWRCEIFQLRWSPRVGPQTVRVGVCLKRTRASVCMYGQHLNHCMAYAKVEVRYCIQIVVSQRPAEGLMSVAKISCAFEARVGVRNCVCVHSCAQTRR